MENYASFDIFDFCFRTWFNEMWCTGEQKIIIGKFVFCNIQKVTLLSWVWLG